MSVGPEPACVEEGCDDTGEPGRSDGSPASSGLVPLRGVLRSSVEAAPPPHAASVRTSTDTNTDPNLVIQQLDIGNLYNGGAKAIDVVKQYPGRFQSMHVKDEILAKEGKEKYESTILGAGIVGVKEVIDAGRQNGTVHFIIEQESYQGKGPVECMKEDFEIMKKWGY